MWFLVLIAWSVAKIVIVILLIAYLWSIVTAECESCSEGLRSGGPRPIAEAYHAFRSIAAY